MKNKIIIEKILRYIEKMFSYIENVDYDGFINNTMLIEACVFNLGQIGELANKVDKDFETCHSQIPWRTLYGLRNKIVHDYDGVNLNLIWEIIDADLNKLYDELKDLYETI